MKRLTYSILAIFCLVMLGTNALEAQTETGVASFYHDKFEGRRTANGEVFHQYLLTAAHKSLPLGTWVRVTNLDNDSTVIVRINDRMPQWNKRSIDLTEAAAGQLNYISRGLTRVLIEIIPNPLLKQVIQRPTDLPVEYFVVPKVQQFAYSAPQQLRQKSSPVFEATAEIATPKKKRR